MHPNGLELFYDGACPLCSREAALLRRLDRSARIVFTDIAAPDFVAGERGLEQAKLMAAINARLPDGQMIEGVEVFRRIYQALGLGWALPLTRLPLIAPLLEAVYRVYAKRRLRWTGRCDAACALPPSAASD